MLLISFCNVGGPKKTLGILNENNSKLEFIDIDYSECNGATGIVRWGYDWIIAGQAIDHSFLAFFSYFFNVMKIYPLSNVKDIHSIYLDGNILYISSTGNNSIYFIRLSGSSMKEELYHQHVPFMDDRVHLNSITKINGEIYYSIFGQKEPNQKWRELLNDGMILNNRGEILIGKISFPHSINVFESRMVYCESGNESFVIDGIDRISLNGFTRGIAFDNDKNYYVGVSSYRSISRHSGIEYENRHNECGVYVINKKRLGKLEVVRDFVFNDDVEIYSIVYWE